MVTADRGRARAPRHSDPARDRAASRGLSAWPAADLRNGQVFIQDNLWSAGRHQYAVWVGTGGTPYAGQAPPAGPRWKIVNLARLPGNPLAAPTADDEHNVYAVGVDAGAMCTSPATCT